MGMGLNFTNTKLHGVTKMHENKIAQVHKIVRSQIRTKPDLHEGTKMHEDGFAPRVYFARLHFLHKSKKIK